MLSNVSNACAGLLQILRERVDYATPTYGVAPPKDYQQIDDATQVYGPDGRLIKKEQRGGPRPVDEVVVIPHVQVKPAFNRSMNVHVKHKRILTLLVLFPLYFAST